MKTTNKLVCIIAFLLCWNIVNAEGYSSTLNSTIYSKYLGSIGSIFYDGPEFVNDLCLSKGNCYVGLWVATGIGGGKYTKSFGNDWDPYIGWVHNFGPLRYEITGTYFFISDLKHIDDDIWIVDQKLTLTKCPVIQPYVKVRFFGEMSSRSPEKGWFFWVGATRTEPLGNLKLNFDLSAAYSDGALGKNPGWVFSRATVSLNIPVSKKLSFTPSVIFQVPIGGQQHKPLPYTTKTEVVWGLNANYAL